MKDFVTILTSIIVLAIIAVLVSNKAQTGSVINAIGNFFTSAVKTAVSPVSGG